MKTKEKGPKFKMPSPSNLISSANNPKSTAAAVLKNYGEQTKIVGHRGFWTPRFNLLKKYVCENSMTSVRGAFSLSGSSEIDIMETSDGKLIVLHDDTLERVAKAALAATGRMFVSGTLVSSDESTKAKWDRLIATPVKDLTYDEIKNINIGEDEGPPLLVDVLNAMNDFDPAPSLFIEIKTASESALAELSPALLRISDTARRNIWFISFEPSDLVRCRKALPQFNIPRMLIFEGMTNGSKVDLAKGIADAKAMGFEGVDIEASFLSLELIELASANNLQVASWPNARDRNSDGEAILKKFIATGKVQYFTTDYTEDLFATDPSK